MEETYLHIYIQHTNPASIPYIFNRLDRCAIHITAKCSMFNEGLSLNEALELVFADKMVFSSVLLSLAGRPGCVAHAEAEDVWVCSEETFEEGGFAGAAGAG
jgi:hypothetical protein